MSIFIKAGLWINKKLGYKGELDLTKYIKDLISSTPSVPPTLAQVTDEGNVTTVPIICEDSSGVNTRIAQGNINLDSTTVGGGEFAIDSQPLLFGWRGTQFLGTNYLTFSPITSGILIAMPIISGTLALTSDLSEYIPLSGTTVGNPVSGDIQMLEYGDKGNLWLDSGISISGLRIGAESSALFNDNYTAGELGYFTVNSSVAMFRSNNPLSNGITGFQDYSPNITDLDYPQVIWVKTKIAESRPYKVYTAILNQVGTDDPTAIILENTLGLIGDLSWARVGIGEYSLSSVSGIFINNKTYLSIQNGYPEIKNDISPAGIYEVKVYSYNITGGGVVPADNNIFDVSIEIRVYN